MKNLARLLPHRSAWKWFYPGLGVKRWLILLTVGITALAIGFGYVLVEIYRAAPLPEIFYYLTLQFIPRVVRGILFGAIGITAIGFAIYRLNRSLLSAFVPDRTNVVEVLYRQRARKAGPKIVALGGGTGLSILLRGLKTYTENLTAIVTVADDGGSSGRLRRELGVLPPGDFRQCIAALADAEPLMTQLFQYRFNEGLGLDGHAFGNLFIAAMSGITGNFERALLESSRVLAVRGQILPSTLENVTLCADFVEENALARVAGESQITARGLPIARVYLEPPDARAYPGAVRAILEADLVIAGPGSLFTSILPNLLVRDIAQALRVSRARKLYVCNIATQPGETDGFSVQDHFRALEDHVGKGIFTHVLANNNFRAPLPATPPIDYVRVSADPCPFALIQADVVDESNPWRHAPDRLARAILEWYGGKETSRQGDR
jgi:uncharacterized cofD-like protein